MHAVIEYATYGQLVLLRQLVHSENSNDILQRLVVLEDLLHGGSDVVVLLSDLDNTSESAMEEYIQATYNTRVQHTRLGVQRVDGGVDTELSNTTRQDSGGVQMGEGGGGGRIGQIIGGDIDGLYGGN